MSDALLGRIQATLDRTGTADYETLLEDLDLKVLVWTNLTESYQGYYAALVRHGDGRIGWTTIGYGSCGGCDALEGTGWDPHGLAKLAREMERDISWHPSIQSALDRIEHDDQLLQWYGHEPNWSAFIAEVRKVAA